MTPAQKLGYKVGNKFEVISDRNGGGYTNIGMIVELIADDGSDLPRFKAIAHDKSKSMDNTGERFIHLDAVRLLDSTPQSSDNTFLLNEYIRINYPKDAFLRVLIDNLKGN